MGLAELEIIFAIADLIVLCLWWVDPGWMPGAHPSSFITRLLSWTQGRKQNKRVVGPDKGRRDHSPVTVMGKTDSAWGKELNLLITNQNQSRKMKI